MTLQLKFNTRDWSRGLTKLRDKAPLAMARALNRSTITARTVMVRATASDIGLKQADVKAAITTRNATPDRLVAQVEAKGAQIPLIKFGANGQRPSRGRGRGVTYRGQNGRQRITDAFIARMATGHEGVFKRLGTSTRRSRLGWSKNLPIVELKGPSIAHVFGKHLAEGEEAGRAALTKNLAHELRYYGVTS